MGRKFMPSVNVKLIQSTTNTSPSNSAYFPVVAISPNGCQDFSGFAALYDEYRVRSMKAHFVVAPSGPVTAVGANAAFAFDPVNSGAYSNASDVQTAQHSVGPLAISLTASPSFPIPHNKSGYWVLKVPKLVPTVLPNGSSVLTAAVGGSWIGTSDPAAVVGYMKGVCSALGSGITSTFGVYIHMDVEFRMRT